MKYISFKYFLVFIVVITSLLVEKPFSDNLNRKLNLILINQVIDAEKPDGTLALNSNETKPASHCEIVESLSISGPVLINSRVRQISNFDFQTIVYLLRNWSLYSHNNLLRSSIIGKNTLVNILRN